MKFISWNIDSINAALTSDSPRAHLTRDVLKMISEQNADIIAIQETKLPEAGMNPKQTAALDSFFCDYDYKYVSSVPPARKGYAGTMILYKKDMELIISFPKIGAPDTMDEEGRMITAEHNNFFFNLVYTPNAGDGLKRLDLRQEWDIKYADYLASLDSKKPVISCGDYNVAHKEIDLANPDSNHMSAGFTDDERAGFTNLLNKGFVDTFRYKNGDVTGAYSWWAQRIKTSKINNSGWRIDYFLVSDRIKDNITNSCMLDSGPRQDHAPIMLEINI
mgnify:CR=1 FL=1